MIWIHALAHTAQVVEHQAVWNLAVHGLVKRTMCQHRRAVTIRRVTVTRFHRDSHPNPATALRHFLNARIVGREPARINARPAVHRVNGELSHSVASAHRVIRIVVRSRRHRLAFVPRHDGWRGIRHHWPCRSGVRLATEARGRALVRRHRGRWMAGRVIDRLRHACRDVRARVVFHFCTRLAVRLTAALTGFGTAFPLARK